MPPIACPLPFGLPTPFSCQASAREAREAPRPKGAYGPWQLRPRLRGRLLLRGNGWVLFYIFKGYEDSD